MTRLLGGVTLLSIWSIFFTTSVNANVSDALHSVSDSLRLRPRQTGTSPISLDNFPPQCRATCTPAVTTANDPNCQAAACQCTTRTFQDLSNCFGCVVQASGGAAATQQTAQNALNGFRNGCASSGFPIGGVAGASSSAGGIATPSPIPSATNPGRPITTAPGSLPPPVPTSVGGGFSSGGGGADDNFTSTPTRPQSTLSAPATGNTPSGNGLGGGRSGAVVIGMHPFAVAFGAFSAAMLA